MATGTYTHTVYSNGRYYTHHCTVTILEETAKRLKIRIPYGIGRHAPGDTMWVLRKSVRKDMPLHDETTDCQHDYPEAWWNRD